MANKNDMYSEDWVPGEILAGDVNGVGLREMMDELRRVQAQCKTALDKGVTPAEFEVGKAILAGFDAATRGLQRSWDKRQKS